jgi:hypothetical protein
MVAFSGEGEEAHELKQAYLGVLCSGLEQNGCDKKKERKRFAKKGHEEKCFEIFFVVDNICTRVCR